MSADAVAVPTAITKTTTTTTDTARIPAAGGAAVRGGGSALTALVSGSWVLAGGLCRCAGRLLRWAWEQASIDPEGQAAVQAHADRTAKVRAKWAKRRAKARAEEAEGAEGAEEVEEVEEVEALGPAPSGLRPFPEALAYLALGGLLVAGAAGTAGALIAPHLALLAPWKPVIITVGGLAWTAGAWMVAPPPKPTTTVTLDVDVEDQEQEDGQDDVVDDADRGTVLLWHVVGALADAESAGRAGLHLDAVLDSATEAGLIPGDTELSVMRAWVEAAGLPVADKVGYRIGGKPVTRVGMKLTAVTDALGMTPTALLKNRSQTPAGGAPATSVRPVGEIPVETAVTTPAEAPAPAPLRLIPGGRQHPAPAPSPALAPGSAQEAR